MNLPLFRSRDLLKNLLSASRDPLRLSPVLHARSHQILAMVRTLGLEGVVGNGPIPSTNRASDQERVELEGGLGAGPSPPAHAENPEGGETVPL